MRTDVHQHLWPAELVEALRRRTRTPYLRGRTLHVDGAAPLAIDPAGPDDVGSTPPAGAGPARSLVLVSLPAAAGIEALPPDDAQALLAAWHDGAAALPAPFGAWASVTDVESDLDDLKRRFADGFAGLHLPATTLVTPDAVDAAAQVLQLCAALDRPVLVHPARTSGPATRATWWPDVVDRPAQLQAAWWAWRAAGRGVAPGLRICFVAGAGLAPLHHERFTASGGGRFVVDPDVFVDTSTYRRQGVDALTRALGVDAVVHGSGRGGPGGRPTAHPFDPTADLGEAATHAITVTNPRRLLEGGPTT